MMFLDLFKKALLLFLSLWCVITATFFLLHAVPGDPFIGDRILPEEVLASLYRYFGLDQPLWVQYFSYLKGLLHMELGPSIVYPGRSVNQFIKEGFPISARLGLQALFIAVFLGIFLGTYAALKKGKWQDYIAMVFATIGVSVPNFVLATLLQFVFAVWLHLLPIARWGGWEHSILPTISLAFLPTAFIARLVRSNLVEILQQDYMKTALAKGIPRFYVVYKHGLRNAFLPVVAYLGPLISQIVTGSFMIEKIYAIPGLGQWMIHSIHNRDYPVILGLTVFFSALLLLCVFLSELSYYALDPRLRAKKKEIPLVLP